MDGYPTTIKALPEEEGWRATDSQPARFLGDLLNSLLNCRIRLASVELRCIEFTFFSSTLQIVFIESVQAKQNIVHLPESSLLARTLGKHRSRQRLGMVRERKMTECDCHLAGLQILALHE